MHTGNISVWNIDDTLDELVSLAWTTFIGSDLVRADTTDFGPVGICSSISIAGPAGATVLFYTDEHLGRLATSSVLGVPDVDLSDADVFDVIGELVNIIGGNLKGVVNAGENTFSLSLPVVSNAMQTVPGSRIAADVQFVTTGGHLGCQILEHV